MFSLSLEHQVLRLAHHKADCYLTMDLQHGATIAQLAFPKLGNIIKAPKGWTLEEGFLYESSWLVPFPNRVASGKYNFQGRSYDMPIEGPDAANALHGFIYDKAFELEEQECYESSAIIKLRHISEGHYPGYPFPFQLNIKIQLSLLAGLAVEVVMENTGDQDMPAGIGWHPYFDFGRPVDELELKLPVRERLALDNTQIPTGEKMPDSRFRKLTRIGNTGFDDCFQVYQDDDHAPEVLLHDSNRGTLIIWMDHPNDYVQVYTPEDRRSIAIEPMTCAPDAFNNQMGLAILSSGEKLISRFSIQYESL